MESLSFIQWCLDNLNYWTITFLMMIESSFIPFPSEIVIIPAAYKAAYGELNMYLVVIFGTLGAFFLHKSIVHSFFLSLFHCNKKRHTIISTLLYDNRAAKRVHVCHKTEKSTPVLV